MERMMEAQARTAGRGAEAPGSGPRLIRTAAAAPVHDAWAALETVELDDAVLDAERIVAWRRADPAHVAFDLLRTRLLALMAAQGWRRVLVTAPGPGCGTTTVAANLAVSLARHGTARTLLLDLDLRAPRLAGRLGLGAVPLSLPGWLASDAPARSHFVRVARGLAVCLNTEPAPNPAEILHAPRTARRLDAAVAALDPAAVVCDLPPMLACDDALGFLPQGDCVLLVAAAGRTTVEEIAECEHLLAGNANFLGVLLNRCTPSVAG